MKKSSAIYRHFSHNCPAYPNEADIRYYQKKLLDILAGLASGVMLIIYMIFLILIS